MNTIAQLKNIVKQNKQILIMLVGVPASGKSTLYELAIKDNAVYISRDSILMELAEQGMTYSDAFKSVNQKEVDSILRERLTQFGATDNNVVVDMTNLTPKRRKGTMAHFPNHQKIAVVFETPPIKILTERNETRNTNEGKNIPMGVFESMISSFHMPTKEEGFSKIFTYKSF